jgi:CRP/FNR family cyclic AMP-dependent transcriptional regulator
MSATAPTVSSTVLKTVPLFAGFQNEQLRTLATVITRRSAPRGSVIMAEGDRVDSLYIVISGRLKVMMGEADGKEVILGILGPGEFFGEMGLIDDRPRSASVIAIEPCELLSVTKSAFKKCLLENFEVAMTVLRVLVRRLREADRKIGSLAMLDVYGRVARLLLDMSENVNGQKVVTKRLPKQDIAKMIGASREMVSMVMRDLEMSGYFEVRGSTIVLRDTTAAPAPLNRRR